MFSTTTPDVKNYEVSSGYYRADETREIYVKSNMRPLLDGGFEVALFSRDAVNGEVFIADYDTRRVYLTEPVAKALNNSRIIESDEETFEAQEVAKLAAARAALQSDTARAAFKKKYVQLLGSDAGFNEAWQAEMERDTLRMSIVLASADR